MTTPTIEIGKTWPSWVPDRDRQVSAAWRNVEEKTCAECSFFRSQKDDLGRGELPVEIGQAHTNTRDQIGRCCYGRTEADTNKMTGAPECEKDPYSEPIIRWGIATALQQGKITKFHARTALSFIEEDNLEDAALALELALNREQS
jgi:hypothetical protein